MIHQECLPIESLRANPARYYVIDVRDPEDHAARHVYGAVNVPLARLLESGTEIPAGRIPVTVCGKGGGRSAEAAEALREAGHKEAVWLCGGTNAWLASTRLNRF